MKPIAKVYTAIIFLFLFAPIAILLVFSFNSGNSLSVFSGFSLYWYKELFQDSNTLEALRNTLVLALCAAPGGKTTLPSSPRFWAPPPRWG